MKKKKIMIILIITLLIILALGVIVISQFKNIKKYVTHVAFINEIGMN